MTASELSKQLNPGQPDTIEFCWDSESQDKQAFSPFILYDYGNIGTGRLSLQFRAWDWLRKHLGSDTINGYYLNGYGVEGLVKAALYQAGIDPNDPRIEYNSEGDTCVLLLHDAMIATMVGPVAANALKNQAVVPQLIEKAREMEWED